MHTITELEDRLRQDPQGWGRKALLDLLASQMADLLRQLRQPQTEADFASLCRRREACKAAMEVISEVWRRQQHLWLREFRSSPDGAASDDP